MVTHRQMNKAIPQVIVTIAILFLPCLDLFASEEKTASGGSTILITAAQIEKMKTHTMVDLLNRIPGISATGSTVHFRGFNTKSILVLLDGREMNDPTSMIRSVNWNRIVLSDVEQIEIIKGGVSGLYGDHAAGGLVRITTKKIVAGLHGNIEGSLGSFNSKQFDAVVGKKFARYGMSVSGSLDTTDGSRPNSGEDQYRFGSKLQYYYSPEDIFSLSADYSYSDMEKSGSTYRPTPSAHSDEENFSVSLILPFNKISSETHFSFYDRSYENPDSNYSTWLNNWSLKQREIWNPSFDYIGALDVSVDFELQHASGANLQSRKENYLGLYWGKKVSFTELPFTATPLQASFGIRTNFHSEFSTAINPSLRLSYDPGVLRFDFTVDRFNTTPSFRRRFYKTSSVIGNPQLKMEKGTNSSLGIFAKPTKSTDVSMSLFYTHTEDLISYVQNDGVGTYENIGSSTKKGIDAALKWVINKKVQLSLSYTYLDARNDQSNKFLAYSPEHEVVFNIDLNPLPDLSVSSITKYKSKRYYNSDNSGSTAGTYFRTNLSGEYTIADNYELFFRIDNLFDTDFHIFDGYPVTPRKFVIGLKYEY